MENGMENGIGKLTAALALVSKSVGSLSPDKRNKEQGYDYISADKVLEIIGKALAEQGVVIIPSVVDDSYETIVYKSYDKEKSRIDARARFIMYITHESGELCVMPWTGYGTDYVTPDKALYKAITSGHKYFLMKLFNVGVGNEDGEHQSHEEPERIVKKAVTKPAPVPQPAKLRPASVVTDGKGNSEHNDIDYVEAEAEAAADSQSKPKAAVKKQAPPQNGNSKATDNHTVLLSRLHDLGTKLWPKASDWKEKRAIMVADLTNGATESSKNLNEEQLTQLVADMAQMLNERLASK